MTRAARAKSARPVPSPHDPEILGELIARWFVAAARELPWRTPGKSGLARDPYLALVAETMLQQTQVSRVLEKFGAFVEEFPNVAALANASEDRVLALWSGLGYYRRARNLHASAKLIRDRFGGRVPGTLEQLRELPGVGAYTAGAIASIAFGRAAAIVDGNVARVLMRIHGKDQSPDDARAWLWERAAELAAAAERPGVVNEGLMELGATVCLPAPASPRCERCPVASLCEARRTGREQTIPRPKHRTARETVHCLVARVERDDGFLLVERRARAGMWAGLWQAPTLERADRRPSTIQLARAVGLRPGELESNGPGPAGSFEFLATHRRMLFKVMRACVSREWMPGRGEFVPRERLAELGMSSPQRRILLREYERGASAK